LAVAHKPDVNLDSVAQQQPTGTTTVEMHLPPLRYRCGFCIGLKPGRPGVIKPKAEDDLLSCKYKNNP